MNKRSVRWFHALGLISSLCLQSATAAEQQTAPAEQGAAGQMGGMQHSMGGMSAGQPATEGMQHGGMGGDSQGQGGMAGMQHGGAGGGMMGGMGGGGGMMSSMGGMTDQQVDEAMKQLQAQDIRLGELRRQMREANDQAVRDKLKNEHRIVLKEQLILAHKLMMHEHMKSMKGSSMSGGQQAPASGPVHHPASPQ